MSAILLRKLSAVYTLHSSLELGSLRYSSECEEAPACGPGELALLQCRTCIFAGTRIGGGTSIYLGEPPLNPFASYIHDNSFDLIKNKCTMPKDFSNLTWLASHVKFASSQFTSLKLAFMFDYYHDKLNEIWGGGHGLPGSITYDTCVE